MAVQGEAVRPAEEDEKEEEEGGGQTRRRRTTKRCAIPVDNCCKTCKIKPVVKHAFWQHLINTSVKKMLGVFPSTLTGGHYLWVYLALISPGV